MSLRKNSMVLLMLALVILLVTSTVCMAEPAQSAGTSEKTLSTGLKADFTDVNANDPNLVFIGYLSQRGLMKGFPDGSFHPGGALTRAEAAALLTRVAGLKTEEATSSFKDVPQTHWAAGSIEAAYKAGYLKGFPDETFQPEKSLSRAEGVALFLRLSKEKYTATLPALQDINSQHWAAYSIALALDAKMIGLSQDGQKFYPEQAYKRGDLARLLGIMVTSEPTLSKTSLSASLKVKSGQVEITRANGKTEGIDNTAVLYPGDTISTGSGEAELNFPDGSGFLLKAQTILAIKQSQGRAYIKADGSPGNGIDFLEVDMKQGKLFGALAAKYEPEAATPASTTNKTSSQGFDISKVAGLQDIKKLLLAAADPAQPWYKTAEEKKVKVKVDMPWGIAAIRGSFWNNTVTSTGNTTSLLEGSAEVTSGGQTLSLGQMQTTSVTGANATPTVPAAMSSAQSKEFVDNKAWVEAKAVEIVNKQAAVIAAPVAVDAVPPPAPPTPVTTQPAVTTPAIPSVVSSAISQASTTAGSTTTTTTTTGTTNNSSSDNSTTMVTMGSYSLTNVASVVYGSQTFVLTKEFGVTPPSALAATSYQLSVKNSSGTYRAISPQIPVAQKIRHLAVLFDKPENVAVSFYRGSNYDPVGIYGLSTGNGLASQATRTISGNITLGAAAATQMTFKIIASGASSGGSVNYYTEQTVTIPAGATTANYSIAVLPNSSYFVYYKLVGNYTQPFVAYQNIATALDLSAANATGQDFTVALGHWVSGKLTLPAEADQNVSFGIIFSGSSTTSSSSVSIASGSTEATYRIAVPDGTYNNVFYNSYNQTWARANDYAITGYYSSCGGSTCTVASGASATSLSVTGDLSDINFTVIPGGYRFIKGTINLPAAVTQPAHLRIYAIGGTSPGAIQHQTFTDVTITSGTSAPYSIYIDSPYTGYSYMVSYVAYEGAFCSANGYINHAFYNSSGTAAPKTCITTPQYINVSAESYLGADMTVVEGGKTISGTASLPAGVPQGTGGINQVVMATNGSQYFYCYLAYASGTTSITYYMVVPAGATYTFYNYPLNGTANMVPANALATVSVGSGDVSGQNFTLKNIASSSGSSGPSSSPIHTRDVPENTVLLNDRAILMDSPYYTPERVADLVSAHDCLYYKSILPATTSKWFNLLDTSITDANSQTYFGTGANAINETDLFIWDYLGGIIILSPDPVLIATGQTEIRSYLTYPGNSITVTKVVDPDPAIATFELDTPSVRLFRVVGQSNPGQTYVTLQATDGSSTHTRDIKIITVPALGSSGSVSSSTGGILNVNAITTPPPAYGWAAGDTINVALVDASYSVVTSVSTPTVSSVAANSVDLAIPSGLTAGNYGIVVYRMDSTGQYIPLGIAFLMVS